MSELREKLRTINEKVDLYLSVSRYAAAEQIIKDSINDLGGLAILFNLLGVTYHRQSKFQDAIDAFQKALHDNPKFVEASLNLSLTFCDLGLYQDAEAIYKDAQKSQIEESTTPLNPLITGRLANFHNQTALAYEQAGLVLEAIREYELALQLYPHMPDVLIKLSDLERKLGRFDRAKSYLIDYERKYSPDAAIYNLLGLIAYQEGDQITAKNRWLKAQDLNPEDHLSRAYLRCLDQRHVVRISQ